MQVEIGSALTYRGRQYLCISEEVINCKEIAKEDSSSMQQYYSTLPNVRCLELSIANFTVGELIHKTGERIVLECPGVDIQYIYTAMTVTIIKKENINGIDGTESAFGQSPDNKVESIRSRNTGRKGNGEETPGEAGTQLHRDGSTGEGGSSIHSKDS